MRYDLAFYAKYKIKVTEAAVIKTPVAAEERSVEQKWLTTLNSKITHPDIIIPKLEADCERYPNNPKLQNYLANVYKIAKNDLMNERVLKATVTQFPDYVFGKVTLGVYYQEKQEWEALNELLGSPRAISNVESYEYIHESLLFNYYRLCIKYAMHFNNFDEAKVYHKMLFEYAPKSPEVKDLAVEMNLIELKNRFANLKLDTNREVKWKPYIASHLSPTKEIPAFFHPEINQFYEFLANETPIEFIDSIMALPRETLIQDLEAVVTDSIRRFEILEEEETDSLIHALFFLGEFRAYESVPKILDILRQDMEYSDFWFGDFMNRYLAPTVFYLTQKDFAPFLAILKEPYREKYVTQEVSSCVAQVALHQPERRNEVIDFYRNLFDFYVENERTEGIIDSDMLGFIMADLIHIRAVELLPQIDVFFQKNLPNKQIAGDWKEVEKEILKPHDAFYLEPMPLNIYEFYDQSYLERRAKSSISNKERELMDTIVNPTDKYEKYLQGIRMNAMSAVIGGTNPFSTDEDDDEDDYVPQAPVKRLVPKVGRNEKCPCGSGSKYKNCCGK
jgi:hypothetical protein